MRRFVQVLSLLYLLLVASVATLLYRRGEIWWPLVVLEYVPRVVFALPLILLVPAAARWRSWLSALALAGATVVVLFPLMRLNLATAPPAPPTPTLRVMSFNVYFQRHGLDGILREVAAAKPDVVVMQAFSDSTKRKLPDELRGFKTVRVDQEFVIASNLPVHDVVVPAPFSDPEASGAFVRYLIDAPLGTVELFNIHPYSPRSGFSELRGEGLRTTLVHGPPPRAAGVVEENSRNRGRQLAGILDAVRAAKHPVIVAGDTNLPGLSPLDRELTRNLRDGFQSVGFGFGYTFPADRWLPWMRIDRVLVGDGLLVTRFEVGGRGASDHRPVIAEIAASH